MAQTLDLVRFDKVDLADPFFDSLKSQYAEFSAWFAKKAAAKEPVYVIEKAKKSGLRGFIYLKVEEGPLDDVNPPRPPARRLKVGTLKIDAHGTKLGERVIKKIFDHAVSESVEEIYVTVFDTHAKLIALFKRYGFVEVAVKSTPNGTEMVLVRPMSADAGDTLKDYPFVHTTGCRFWLLAIYPEYHSNLFPDSILNTESPDILQDVSHTNTIHKVYVGGVPLTRMKPGDIVVPYRTTDIPGRARYRSVATSVCVVEDVCSRKQLITADALVAFAEEHSVFDEDELRDLFAASKRLYAVRMTYNLALPKRPNREALLEDVGVSEQPRWQLRELSKAQFQRIIELGEVDEGLIVD
jgi:L-amino acid N-acyltransferase YncA